MDDVNKYLHMNQIALTNIWILIYGICFITTKRPILCLDVFASHFAESTNIHNTAYTSGTKLYSLPTCKMKYFLRKRISISLSFKTLLKKTCVKGVCIANKGTLTHEMFMELLNGYMILFFRFSHCIKIYINISTSELWEVTYQCNQIILDFSLYPFHLSSVTDKSSRDVN